MSGEQSSLQRAIIQEGQYHLMFPQNLEKQQATIIMITCPQDAEHCAGQLKFFISLKCS